MDWFKLLPSYFVPGHPPDHLRDFFIILTAIIALVFVGLVLWQTYTSLCKTKPYLDIFKASLNSSDDILKSDLPLILELRHHLVDFPVRDGMGRFLKRRTVDADQIFRDTDLGPDYATSRLMLAIPSILTGLGVLGTFIGLALGLGSLQMTKAHLTINNTQQLELEAAAKQGAEELVTTVKKLSAKSPEAASASAEAAAKSSPKVADKIAEAALAGTDKPDAATAIAASVAHSVPSDAPQIAAIAAKKFPNAAVQVYQSVAEAVPQAAEAIANEVVSAVPEKEQDIQAAAQAGVNSKIDTQAIENSIILLIPAFAAAFSSSVWGVGMSLLCSGIEKILEALALGRVRKIQYRIDDLFPRYVPEEAMLEIETTSRRTEELLQNLAVAIGAEMQKAIGRLGAEIQKAVSDATSQGHGPLMEKSAELLSAALTAELASLKKQISSMAEQFSEKFNGASLELASSVQGFKPTIEILTTTVGNAQQTVFDAVTKLNSHEKVMQEMAEVAKNFSTSAGLLSAMSGSLEISATRNKEAADAQLSATQSNAATANKFDEISQRLPEMRDNLEKAADVISTIIGPISELKTILENFKKETKENNDKYENNINERDNKLLIGTSELVAAVDRAANKFSEVEGFSDSLKLATQNLNSAAIQLGQLGSTIKDASDMQSIASEASRLAALSGENAAKALEPIPIAIANLTGGLENAGSSVRDGALAAKDSYQELINLQKQWFAGASLGLNSMKEQLQSLINAYGKESQEQLTAYGSEVELQTRNLIEQWTGEVNKCLESYSIQVGELQGGLHSLQSVISKLQKP